MSELLSIYQDNLNVIFNKISKLLLNLSNLPTGIKNIKLDKFDLVCKDLDVNLKEAERMLKQMDLEITTNTQLESSRVKGIYTTNKTRYEDFKSKYFKSKENYTYTKKMEEMIITTQQEAQEENSIMQLKSKEGNNLLTSKINEKIETAKRSALAIENTSKHVMSDLENQSQQLKQTNIKVNNLSTSIEASNSIITRMMNRENRSKALIGVFSATLLTVFLFILSSRL